jgi:hypothetical protein
VTDIKKENKPPTSKRNYNLNIWQDSDAKVFVPINPGENFMNEKLDLSVFSVAKQSDKLPGKS